MAMEWYDAVPITEVYNRLYVGGYVQASKLPLSNPEGIEAVLDVSTEPPYDEAKGIVYAHIPFDDGHGVPAGKFWACMRFLWEQYSKGKKVLVHCAAGMSRSVCIAAAFLFFAKIMDFEDAVNWVRERRRIAQPHRDVLISIRQHLKVWPYDGSMGETSQP